MCLWFHRLKHADGFVFTMLRYVWKLAGQRRRTLPQRYDFFNTWHSFTFSSSEQQQRPIVFSFNRVPPSRTDGTVQTRQSEVCIQMCTNRLLADILIQVKCQNIRGCERAGGAQHITNTMYNNVQHIQKHSSEQSQLQGLSLTGFKTGFDYFRLWRWALHIPSEIEMKTWS